MKNIMLAIGEDKTDLLLKAVAALDQYVEKWAADLASDSSLNTEVLLWEIRNNPQPLKA